MKRFALILLATTFAAPVLANDLPGVDKPKPIVQPLPEPIDGRPAIDKDAVKIGDWDVKISGFVRTQVSVGPKLKKRR